MRVAGRLADEILQMLRPHAKAGIGEKMRTINGAFSSAKSMQDALRHQKHMKILCLHVLHGELKRYQCPLKNV